jgi:thymidylate synthase (FAD)
MGKVVVLDETTVDPIVLIGKMAGICWGANIENEMKNYKRGVDCLQSGHGRTLEYPNITLELDGYSARVIREFYTHIGGAPTRLQASTRYIDYNDFEYVVPPKILQNITAQNIYHETMFNIINSLEKLEELNIPREDTAMLLPLGMTTKIVVKMNLRELIAIFNQRLCSRAYWEFRNLMNDIKKALIEYGNRLDIFGIGNQWEQLAKNYFVPKCEKDGVCYEKYCCGRMPQAERKSFN